jgi:hypothetical protein
MHEVEVIEQPEAAIAALDPMRARLLRELATPQSAAMLAAKLGLPRQKLNYHLHQLEARGLVVLHEERAHGGLTERVLAATASAFFVDPTALGARAPAGAEIALATAEAAPGGASWAGGERLSARYLIALAARVVREVGRLARRGPVSTLALDAEIGFASAEDRKAFADDLTLAITELAARYHHDGGRMHRLVVASHEIPNQEVET